MKKNITTLILKIMKVGLMVFAALLTSAGTLVAETVFSQNLKDVKVSINLKGESLERAIEKISKTSKLDFSYNNNELRKVKGIILEAEDRPLDEILNEILDDTPFSFRVADKNIVIFKRRENILVGQEIIKGKVTDDMGVPLAGVTVSVKGTSKAVKTGADGSYQIETTSPGDVLVFTYMGLTTTEVVVGTQQQLNVVMKDDQKILNEVVVVGYGVQKKINLSGAVDGITSKDIENRPFPNIGAGLQGLIPNLNVTITNGQANSAPSFNIRGYTSLNGGGPYILVDNVPFTAGELMALNPNDVESVSVLKDAASAAIYGARGAFGVILITTKRAKSDQLKVSANTYYAIRTLGKVPEIVTDPLKTMEYKHDAAYPLYNLFPENVREYAKQRSENPSLPAVIISPTDPNAWMYYGSTNWLDEVYNKTAPTYSANMNISKRDDKLSYYVSSEYYRNDGMLRYGNDILDRYNIRAKADYQLRKWLNIGNNTSFMSSTYDAPAFYNSDLFHNINRQSSLDVPFNPDGSWTSAGANTLGRLQSGGRSVSRMNNFQTTFNAVAGIINGVWDFKADATFRRINSTGKSFDIPVPYKTGPNSTISYAGANPTWAQNDNGSVRHNIYNVYTDFHKTFGEKHYVQALLGFNQEYRYENTNWVNRKGLISNTLPSVSLATGDVTGAESITDWAVRGWFYRLNYIFDDKYILELNGRYDGTSRFPDGDRWGFFPSASAAWVVNKERFFQPLTESIGIDLLKLRASYGALGNQDVGAYDYIPTMGSGQIGQILDGKRPVEVRPPGAVAPSLTWEKVSTINFGGDLGFFKNRLEINFDAYTRYTEGMLTLGKSLPGPFGTAEPRLNAADLKTKGWELRVGWNDSFNASGSQFYYGVKLSVADSRSYITKFDNPTNLLSANYVGREIGEIWGLETEGFFQSKEELASHPDQTAVGADDTGYKFDVGDLKFRDLNGDGVINKGNNTLANPGDQRIIGNNRARYFYSADLNAGWKGFDVRFFFQGVGKRDWYPNAGNHYFWGVYAQPWTNVQVHNLDSWTPETPNAYFPRVKAYIAEDATELGNPQTKYLQDASYLRLKNLTLGYTLPTAITSKMKVDKLRFYFSAENVFGTSHLKANLDPEGLDGTVYPFQKTFSFGLNLNF
ncbi:SusC/RagA family TonB-linked outer membrane protein [Pedobacter frigoris]|uniref:SusC/RagA family TonB-linked outer membrane protein n=1 Tax=Pedobacter frigoris TaxID=2571272 RepID=UPI00292CAF23|nr:SusC/RagA family TonB-linked outer membrane protein [Pedobacter frigoris]